MSNSGVTKLSIIGYKDIDYKEKIGEEDTDFKVMANPTNLSFGGGLKLPSPKKGVMTSDNNTQNISPDTSSETLKFSFVLDGTGVLTGGQVKDVANEIEILKQNCIYLFEQKPPYTQITYGEMQFFGIASSISVEHTMFKKSGDPLRSKISLEFTGARSKELNKALIKNKQDKEGSFPRNIVAKKDDSLTSLCQEVYKNINFYMLVAADNNLTSLSDIEGKTIRFKDPKDF